MEVKDLVASLRERLGLLQRDIVERSEGAISQDVISKVENGRNKLGGKGGDTRDALAVAFRLDPTDFKQYLDGELRLDEVVLRVKDGGDPIPRDEIQSAPPDDRPGIDIEALLREISGEHHDGGWSSDETDRARLLVKRSRRGIKPGTDLRIFAKQALQAIRELGIAATDAEIAIRMAQGKPVPVRRAGT